MFQISKGQNDIAKSFIIPLRGLERAQICVCKISYLPKAYANCSTAMPSAKEQSYHDYCYNYFNIIVIVVITLLLFVAKLENYPSWCRLSE